MNELFLQSHFEDKAQMKTNNSYNSGILRYQDDNLEEIAAIVCVFFLFCRLKVRRNRVHANPLTLLLLLILLLLRYSDYRLPIARNDAKYAEGNDFNSNVLARNTNAKDDFSYLGGYEPGYSVSANLGGYQSGNNDYTYLGGHESGHEQKYDNEVSSQVESNGLTESDSVEQVIFSEDQEVEVTNEDIVDLNAERIKKIVEEFLNKERPKDENNEDKNNE